MPTDSFLSKEEISNFKKGGMKLDDNKLYVMKFAFNDQRNKATDPADFQIKAGSLDKIAQTAISRPYVFNPGIKGNVGEHVRGPEDDPAKIVKFQRKYAIGDIVNYFKKDNNNVYFIIEIYPEFENDVKTGKIPLPTSPLIEPLDMDENRVVSDARVLHLQAVPNSGYPMQLTSQLGLCKGMLDECSRELQTLGASGQLKKFQSQFYYNRSALGASMSMNDSKTNGPSGDGQMDIKDLVGKHEQMLADHNKTLGAIGDTLKDHGSKLDAVLKSVSEKQGDQYPGTDGSKGATTGAGKGQNAGMGTYGSAGELITVPKKEYEELVSTVKDVKTAFDEETKTRKANEEKLAQEARLAQAKIIAQGEAILKEIPVEKIDERTKYYINLKQNDKPVDLSLTAAKYSKLVAKTFGSSNKNIEDSFVSLETLGASGSEDEFQSLDMLEVIE